MAYEKPLRFMPRMATAVRNFFCHAVQLPKKRSVVVCRRDQMPAAVVLDEKNQLLACSRREDNIACGEDCASQLRYTTDDLETFLFKNRGECCHVCGTPIGARDWYKSRIAGAYTPRLESCVMRDVPGSAHPICCDCFR